MLRAFAILSGLVVSSTAFAQAELPAPVKFGDGEFTFTRVEDDETAVSYKGIELYRNYFISFGGIVKVEEKDVALISGGDGGNACGPAYLIVTLPADEPDPKVETVGSDCGAPEPSVSSDRILFVPYVQPGKAELIQEWTPSKGLRQNGEIRFLPQPNTNWANFDASRADYAAQPFDNKDFYDTALALLGERLGEVAFGLSVAGPAEIIDKKYVAYSGCQPHACGAANAFIGVDLEKHAVYAANRISDKPEEFWPSDFKSWPDELQKAYEKSKAE